MPLRDNFRSPVNDTHSWDEVPGQWPGEIVRDLRNILPAACRARWRGEGCLSERYLAIHQTRAQLGDAGESQGGAIAQVEMLEAIDA
jgi:hypothetical protein